MKLNDYPELDGNPVDKAKQVYLYAFALPSIKQHGFHFSAKSDLSTRRYRYTKETRDKFKHLYEQSLDNKKRYTAEQTKVAESAKKDDKSVVTPEESEDKSAVNNAIEPPRPSHLLRTVDLPKSSDRPVMDSKNNTHSVDKPTVSSVLNADKSAVKVPSSDTPIAKDNSLGGAKINLVTSSVPEATVPLAGNDNSEAKIKAVTSKVPDVVVEPSDTSEDISDEVDDSAVTVDSAVTATKNREVPKVAVTSDNDETKNSDETPTRVATRMSRHNRGTNNRGATLNIAHPAKITKPADNVIIPKATDNKISFEDQTELAEVKDAVDTYRSRSAKVPTIGLVGAVVFMILMYLIPVYIGANFGFMIMGLGYLLVLVILAVLFGLYYTYVETPRKYLYENNTKYNKTIQKYRDTAVLLSQDVVDAVISRDFTTVVYTNKATGLVDNAKVTTVITETDSYVAKEDDLIVCMTDDTNKTNILYHVAQYSIADLEPPIIYRMLYISSGSSRS